MTDYDTDIRSLVRDMLADNPALPLLDSDYAAAFNQLVNDAVRICDDADKHERRRLGEQSWLLSASFGHPGQLLTHAVAMLVQCAVSELHYHTATARAQGSGGVTEQWVGAALGGKLGIKGITP